VELSLQVLDLCTPVASSIQVSSGTIPSSPQYQPEFATKLLSEFNPSAATSTSLTGPEPSAAPVLETSQPTEPSDEPSAEPSTEPSVLILVLSLVFASTEPSVGAQYVPSDAKSLTEFHAF
jgi:hypothetical protein